MFTQLPDDLKFKSEAHQNLAMCLLVGCKAVRDREDLNTYVKMINKLPDATVSLRDLLKHEPRLAELL